MGGLLTLWLGANHPEIAGLLVFAPALNIPNLWQTNLVWPFVKFMYKKNIDLSSPWQGFNVVPFRAASQLYQFQQKMRRLLPKINNPISIFQGKLDTTINPISAVETLEHVSSTDKELVWLEESTHCILLDKQMDIVQGICLEFIQKHTR
jgi:carboxylesterase